MNGTLVPDDQARVPVTDHGLTTGDGVFEALKVTGGVPFALTRHLARLCASARGLGLAEPDLDQIRAAGDSVLGSQRTAAAPVTIIQLADLHDAAPTCDVIMFPWPRNERGALAGVKTTSYAENVFALSYAQQQGGAEAIFGNLAGNLCEGSGTNVFVVAGGRLVTPPLSSGCLAGVTRGLVIEWAGAVEENLPQAALAGAREAFLTGTSRDVQPIRSVDGVALPAAPGPVTRKAADIFADRSAEDLDP